MLRHAVRSLTISAESSVESLGVKCDSGVVLNDIKREGSNTQADCDNGKIETVKAENSGVEASVMENETEESAALGTDRGGGGGGGTDVVRGGAGGVPCSTTSVTPTSPQPSFPISIVIGDSTPSTISPSDSSLRSKFPREDDRAVTCTAFLTDARRLPLPLQSIRSSLTTRVLVCRVGCGDGAVESIIASRVK
jgi:hypothetical protein